MAVDVAFWYASLTPSADHGNLPSCTGEAKHPILVRRELGPRAPAFQHPQHLGINGHRLLRAGGFYVADPLTDDAPLD
jgi:hypothetical protein